MNRFLTTVAVITSFAAALPASATTYVINRAVGTGNVGGTITTDNTVGTLTTANITGYSLTLTNGASSTSFTQANGSLDIFRDGLTATATGLFFNYALTSYALFQAGTISMGGSFFCLQGSGSDANCFRSSPSGDGLFITGSTLTTTNRSGNLQIAAVQAAPSVPEPATWALMIVGVGAVGVACRRRQVTTRVRFA